MPYQPVTSSQCPPSAVGLHDLVLVDVADAGGADDKVVDGGPHDDDEHDDEGDRVDDTRHARPEAAVVPTDLSSKLSAWSLFNLNTTIPTLRLRRRY